MTFWKGFLMGLLVPGVLLIADGVKRESKVEITLGGFLLLVYNLVIMAFA